MSTEQVTSEHPEGPSPEELLITDYVLGRCDDAEAERARRLIETDPERAAQHREMAPAAEALAAYEVPEPSANLVERTLARVAAQRQTEALFEQQMPTSRRSIRAPWFSLREVAALAAMVVLAAGILIPSLYNARRHVARDLCAANMGRIGTGMLQYAAAHGGVLPASPVNRGPWLPEPGQPRASNSAGLFLLIPERFADADDFQCPASSSGEPFQYQAGMVDFPGPQSIGYSYQYCLDEPLRQERARRAPEMVILADETPIFHGGRFVREALRGQKVISRNHGGAGQNVLRLDGGVGWATHSHVGVDGDHIYLVQGVTDYTGRERPSCPTDTFLLPNDGP
jgi:hypothetical protein